MAIQISVFIENKEGRIKKAIDTLAKVGVNIRALSVGDSSKYGILRLIVSDNEKAIKMYESFGFVATGKRPHAWKYEDGTYADMLFMIKPLIKEFELN